MNNINIDDQEISFEMNSNDSNYHYFLDWMKMVNEKPKEEEWIELEIMPGIHFKNLKIQQQPLEESDDIQITFKCDEWVKID